MSETPAVVAASTAVVTVTCAGCGHVAPADAAFPARCPRVEPGDDIDHLMTRAIDLAAVRFAADDDPNPFIRHRELFRACHVARAAAWPDERYVGLVARLDDAVARVDGHGFRSTPFARSDALSATLGFASRGGVWVKDETGNVSGSHKARHLMGVMLELLVAETLDTATTRGQPLAIASCGNAALAAAVVAQAVGRPLDVFVPLDADPAVLERLEHLEARVVLVPRAPGEPGDPTVRRLHEAVAAGAVPFTCQGPENGLTIEGGSTLAYELASAMAADAVVVDRVIVQVGGGALASSCMQGLSEARSLGVIGSVPRLDTVQTTGAWPLRRALDGVRSELRRRGMDATGPLDPADPVVHEVLGLAARHRSAFMRPWEGEPRSIAQGILDDETYDWLAVVRAMLEAAGQALVVDEATLVEAGRVAAETTGVVADETGTAGLAGLLDLLRHGAVGRDERVAVLFTGARRGYSPAAAVIPSSHVVDRRPR